MTSTEHQELPRGAQKVIWNEGTLELGEYCQEAEHLNVGSDVLSLHLHYFNHTVVLTSGCVQSDVHPLIT